MQSSGGFYILYNGLGLHNPAGFLLFCLVVGLRILRALCLLHLILVLYIQRAFWFFILSLVVLSSYRIKSSGFCLFSFLLPLQRLACFLFYFLQR